MSSKKEKIVLGSRVKFIEDWEPKTLMEKYIHQEESVIVKEIDNDLVLVESMYNPVKCKIKIDYVEPVE